MTYDWFIFLYSFCNKVSNICPHLLLEFGDVKLSNTFFFLVLSLLVTIVWWLVGFTSVNENSHEMKIIKYTHFTSQTGQLCFQYFVNIRLHQLLFSPCKIIANKGIVFCFKYHILLFRDQESFGIGVNVLFLFWLLHVLLDDFVFC